MEKRGKSQTEVAVFGGGCFWCTEAVFKRLDGVISALPGYAGGQTPNPSYEQVSAGQTGHVEVARVEFDPHKISFHDLLSVFFATHDPTTLDRQGNDIGPQYRSVIFYTTEEQAEAADHFISELNESNPSGRPIVTEVRPLEQFYPAEDYHQNYYERHRDEPYCQLVINPKLEKVQKHLGEILETKGKSDKTWEGPMPSVS